MALWTKAGILIGIVAAIVATIAHFPARYAPVVRLAAKHAFGTAARFCCDHTHPPRHRIRNTPLPEKPSPEVAPTT